MKWEKKGLIFNPTGKFPWATSHALQPTPLVLGDRIRIFVGLRDDDGVSRIGYVDVDIECPSKVLGYSKEPIIDIGKAGAFDEFGVVPSSVVKFEDKLLLYYAGYQRGFKARFLVLGGLAISYDHGESFTRIKETPVFERTPDELLFRVPHTVMLDKGKWRVWYGGGSHFETGSKKSLPVYNIRYTESICYDKFEEQYILCLDTNGDEYRLGRPFVFVKNDEEFHMFYGFSTESEPYKLGYAKSMDRGLSWIRMDHELNLPLSISGWDSEMMAYPSVIKIKENIYMFYNGNNYGYDGFGLAELINW